MVGTPPRVFRDTARLAVALLLWRDMVMRPRKGDFAFCLWSAQILCGSFCFLFVERTAFMRFILHFRFRGTAATDPHQKLKSVGVQPLGFGKGWSPSQGRNSASSSQKFAHIKRKKLSAATQNKQKQLQRTKPPIQKPHADKTISRPAILHNKPNNQRASILHAALTDNIAERR